MPALLIVSPQSPTPWESKLKLKLLTTTTPCLLCVRVLFALVAIHMLVIALPLCNLQLTVNFSRAVASSKSEWVELNVALTVWISVLLYGGYCGMKAAWGNSVTEARQTLDCWIAAAIVHLWYLLAGMELVQRQLLSPVAQLKPNEPLMSWSTVALHVVTDGVTMAFIVLFVAVLRTHEEEEDASDASETLPLLSPKHRANEAPADQV